MASNTGLLLSVIVLGMLWIWWPVLLGGVAASQQACVDQANAIRNGGIGRRLLISISRSCSTQWSFAWWTVWLQFFCNVLATIAAVIPAFRDNFGFSVSAMFIVEVAILMVGSGSLNSLVVDSEDYTNKKNETRSAAQAALAGAVGLMIFDLVYIFCTTSKVEWLYPAIITSSSGSTTGGTAAPAKAAPEPYVAPTTVALAETSKPNPDPEVHIEAGSGEAK